jgi:hypothetical protein
MVKKYASWADNVGLLQTVFKKTQVLFEIEKRYYEQGVVERGGGIVDPTLVSRYRSTKRTKGHEEIRTRKKTKKKMGKKSAPNPAPNVDKQASDNLARGLCDITEDPPVVRMDMCAQVGARQVGDVIIIKCPDDSDEQFWIGVIKSRRGRKYKVRYLIPTEITPDGMLMSLEQNGNDQIVIDENVHDIEVGWQVTDTAPNGETWMPIEIHEKITAAVLLERYLLSSSNLDHTN